MPNLIEPAEGLPPRRAFTVAEVLRMQETGIIGEEENFELIEGEIVAMGPKFAAHELIKSALAMGLSRVCPDDLWLGFETSIFLSPTTFVEPDICLYRRGLASDKVTGADLLLVIEIAASSLAYDRGLKASLYARFGVRELWVVDATTRKTFMHCEPREIGWGTIVEKAPDEALRCDVIPNFSIRLADV
jgi:Uma2 family endonuclease